MIIPRIIILLFLKNQAIIRYSITKNLYLFILLFNYLFVYLFFYIFIYLLQSNGNYNDTLSICKRIAQPHVKTNHLKILIWSR